MFGGSLYGEGYVSVLDAFQDVYGVRAGLIFLIPLAAADILFAATVLSSLGELFLYLCSLDAPRDSSIS